MSYKQAISLFELVCAALPAGFDPNRLKECAKAEWWEDNPKLALAWALRKCHAIDWDAYVADNPAIASLGVEPAWHFLRHGVFTGKKLFLRKYADNQPAGSIISVIVYNHNAARYLQKSVESILGQTFQEFEIVIVDDASVDGSQKWALQLAGYDSRVRLLEQAEFMDSHMGRKAGVLEARGKFCMFLNAGCYFHPRALAIAYAGIARGMDIFSFEAGLLESVATWTGSLPPGSGHVILPKSFSRLSGQYVARVLASRPVTSIYTTELCREAFAYMEDDNLGCMAEFYEAVVLDKLARKRDAVKDKLVMCYNINKLRDKACGKGTGLPAIRRHMEQRGGGDYYPALRTLILDIMVAALLREKLDSREFTEIFNALADQCGIYELLDFFVENYSGQLQMVAERFWQYDRNCVSDGSENNAYGIDAVKQMSAAGNPRIIGILYSILMRGGAERVIIELTHMLIARGYEVVIFLESPHPYEEKLPTDVKKLYIGGPFGSPVSMRRHLEALGEMLRQNPVDIMLCHACYAAYLLWELMLLKYFGIGTILFMHAGFFSRLMRPEDPFSLQDAAAVFRCGDKAAVLSQYEELYYRSRGVDAQYLPNPVRLPKPGWTMPINFEQRRYNIIVAGRLGEAIKNFDHCLHVLKCIASILTRIKMTFVGSFFDADSFEKFWNLAAELDVTGNICVTGWLDDYSKYIDMSGVYLCCSYAESFSLTIAEAQGRGVPVVMYDLPIAPAENNPGIVRVQQGDFRGAAREIIALLSNKERWLSLSQHAREKMRQFSVEHYIDSVIEIMRTWQNHSSMTYYKPEQYRVVMRALAFYGAHMPPWMRK